MTRKIIGSLFTSLFIFSFALTPLAEAQTVTIAQLQAQLAALEQQLSALIASQSATATQTTTVVPTTTSTTVSSNSSYAPAGYTEVYTQHNYNKTWHIFFSPSARTWFTEKTDDKTGAVDWTHPVVKTVTDLGNSTNCGQVDSESGRNGCIGTAIAGSITALLNAYPLPRTSAPQGAVLKFPSSYITANSYEIDYVPSSGTWVDTKANGNGLDVWVHPNITASGLVTECGLIQRDANPNTLLALSSVDQVAANDCAFRSVTGAYNVAGTTLGVSLTSVTPTSTAVGGQVTITGSTLNQSSQIVLDGSTVLPGLQFGVNTANQSYIVVAIPSGTSAGSHTLQLKMPGGGLSNAVTITVAVTPSTAPTVSLSANPTSITYGQSSVLVPSSQNALTCSGNANGLSVVYPTQTTTYTYTCSNAAGTNSASVTVTVSNAVTNGPTVNVSANPTSINPGQSATITTTISGATSCVSNIPGQDNNYNDVNPVSPTQTTTYSMTCTNSAGQSATGSATVTVNTPYTGPTVSLSSSPSFMTIGQSSVLSFTSSDSVSGIASCTINGQPQTPTSGSITVSPMTSTDYTFTCVSNASKSASATASVNIQGLMPTDTYTPSSNSSNVFSGLQALLQALSQQIGK